MKALTHADGAMTCIISAPVIASARCAKKFLGDITERPGCLVGVNLNVRAVTRRGGIAANSAKAAGALAQGLSGDR